MAKSKWNPAEFHHWYDGLPIEKRERVWNDQKREHQKLYIEWKTFRDFADASGLKLAQESIENCDPNACVPPLPDVRCLVAGKLEYFELGEVTDEDLARTASIALKNRASVYGGAISQNEPLIRIFLKKCRNRYSTDGAPLHLVLHFAIGRQSPFTSFLQADVERCSDKLIRRIRKSQFDRVWVYDDWEKKVLVCLDRTTLQPRPPMLARPPMLE